MKSNPQEYRKHAAVVWDFIQERITHEGAIAALIGIEIEAWPLPQGGYELAGEGNQKSIFIDSILFEFAKRIADAEGVRIKVHDAPF